MAEAIRDLTERGQSYAPIASLHLLHRTLRPAQPRREFNLSDVGSLLHRGEENDESLTPLRELDDGRERKSRHLIRIISKKTEDDYILNVLDSLLVTRSNSWVGSASMALASATNSSTSTRR